MGGLQEGPERVGLGLGLGSTGCKTMMIREGAFGANPRQPICLRGAARKPKLCLAHFHEWLTTHGFAHAGLRTRACSRRAIPRCALWAGASITCTPASRLPAVQTLRLHPCHRPQPHARPRNLPPPSFRMHNCREQQPAAEPPAAAAAAAIAAAIALARPSVAPTATTTRH